MKEVHFHYGKEKVSHKFDDGELLAVLTSSIEEYVPEKGEAELVEEALKNPIESQSLSELAKGKKNIVIIASDHTRPVPSKVIMPPMLREIRKGNPDADITILIATGCHRGTTKDELISKFGEDIVNNEKITNFGLFAGNVSNSNIKSNEFNIADIINIEIDNVNTNANIGSHLKCLISPNIFIKEESHQIA